MPRPLKWTLIGVGSFLGVIAALILALILSKDFLYRLAYFVAANFDVNDAVTPDQAQLHFHTLKAVKLIDVHGHPFDWNAGGKAVIWINEWSYFCAPCIIEFADMKALQERVGKDKLRVVLLSQPEFWKKDKKKSSGTRLEFEQVVPQNASVEDLAAIKFGKVKNGKAVGEVFPSSSFMRANGVGLAAFRSPRPWDSMKWENIIRGWYNGNSR